MALAGLEAQPEVEWAQLSITGGVRPNNEDYIAVAAPATPQAARELGWLVALADGVGGAENGEIAAREAAEYLVRGWSQGPPAEAAAARLSRLMREANHHVYHLWRRPRGDGHPPLPMATTLVACAIQAGRAYIAHAGDSRCYLVRGAHARCLTRDHIRHTGWWLSPRRRPVLSRAVGADMLLQVASRQLELAAGDVLALTSDGFHLPLSPADLAQKLAAKPDLELAARELVELAAHRDNSDNISLALIRLRAPATF